MSKNAFVGHYYCICGEAYSKKSQLRNHIKVCKYDQYQNNQCVPCPIKKKMLKLAISKCEIQSKNYYQSNYKDKIIKRFKCGCEKVFQSKGGYYRHVKKCKLRPKQQVATGKTKCNEPGCLLTFKYIRDLRQHLSEVHNIQFDVEEKIFNRYSDFLCWKENYEKETRSCFYHRKTETRSGRKVEYWYCNRSGIYQSAPQSNRKRKLKSQGILKINNNCTSSITLSINDNDTSVQVIIYHTHYGHEAELEHLRIPKSDKQEITSKLLQGIKIEDILLSYKTDETSKQIERKHLIKRRDILNISKKCNIKLPKVQLPRQKKNYKLPKDTIKPVLNKALSLNTIESKKRHLVASQQSLLFVIPINENIWKISMENYLVSTNSSNNQEDIYHVHVTKNYKECCSDNNCKAFCHYCNICYHSYSCTCSDFSSKSIICEHVHLVVLFQNTEQHSYHCKQSIEKHLYNNQDHTAYTKRFPESISSTKLIESISLSEIFQENKDDTLNDQHKKYENLKSLKIRMENLINETLQKVSKCNNCNLLEDIERQMTNIAYNLDTDILQNEKKIKETQTITPKKMIEVFYAI